MTPRCCFDRASGSWFATHAVAWRPPRGNYPVGSGDAFLAGILTALTAGDSWPQSAMLGLGAAAANAETRGAARLDPSRAREIAATADIRPAP